MEILFQDDKWFDEQTELFVPKSKNFWTEISKFTISELSKKYDIHPYFVYFSIESIKESLMEQVPVEQYDKIEELMTPKSENFDRITDISDIKLILSVNKDNITNHIIIYKDQNCVDRFFETQNIEIPGMVKYFESSKPDIINLINKIFY